MNDGGERRTNRGIAPGFALSAAKRYAGDLRRYLKRRLGRVEDVDDLAQEVYFRLLRINPDTRVRKPLAFVYGVARRVLADHRSDIAAEEEHLTWTSDALAWMDPASEALADRLEDRLSVEQQLRKALSEIPSLHAAILVLHKRDGLSYEEVAVELDISVHTVKKYLTEARTQLRMKRWDK